MKKQLGILLIVLLAAVGISGVASASESLQYYQSLDVQSSQIPYILAQYPVTDYYVAYDRVSGSTMFHVVIYRRGI